MFLFLLFSSLKYFVRAEFCKQKCCELSFSEVLFRKYQIVCRFSCSKFAYQGWCGTLLPLSKSGVVFLLSCILLLSHPPEQIRIAPSPLPVSPTGLAVPLSSSLVRTRMSARDPRQGGVRNVQTWRRSRTVVKIIMRSAGVWHIISVILSHILPLDTEIQRFEWTQPFSDDIIQNCGLVVYNIFSLDTL